MIPQRNRYFVLLVFLFTTLLVIPAGAGEPSDLEQYIGQIRASGMSEDARSSVQMTAGIYLGHTILEYQEDPASGRYWPGYRSSYCPKPGADPDEIKKIREKLDSEAEQVAALLRPLADSDGSGFVTTKEGWEFRQLVEFGYFAAAATENGDPSVGTIAKAVGLPEAQVRDRLKQYLEFTAEAERTGLDLFPAVTVEL